MTQTAVVKGFDYSNNQADIQFDDAFAAGFRFTVGKVTEGLDWIDPAYLPNAPSTSNRDRVKASRIRREAAIDAGLLWTGYMWPHPQPRRDPEQEADHFRVVMDQVGWKAGVDLPPWIDIEANYRNSYGVLSSAELVDYVFDLIGHVDNKFGCRSTIYTGYVWRDSTWRNPATGQVVPALGNPTRECKNPLCLAAYVENPDGYTPKSWAGRKKTFHQRSESYPIPGVGRGDLDLFMGDLKALTRHIERKGK